MSGLRVTKKQWEHCIFIFLRERTILRIKEELRISKTTVQKMTRHIRECMKDVKSSIFEGPVEMDETYIGG